VASRAGSWRPLGLGLRVYHTAHHSKILRRNYCDGAFTSASLPSIEPGLLSVSALVTKCPQSRKSPSTGHQRAALGFFEP